MMRNKKGEGGETKKEAGMTSVIGCILTSGRPVKTMACSIDYELATRTNEPPLVPFKGTRGGGGGGVEFGVEKRPV